MSSGCLVQAQTGRATPAEAHRDIYMVDLEGVGCAQGQAPLPPLLAGLLDILEPSHHWSCSR